MFQLSFLFTLYFIIKSLCGRGIFAPPPPGAIGCDWYSGLDLGQPVGLVFIDLKKAFDTVDHDILYQKFQIYGVQGR